MKGAGFTSFENTHSWQQEVSGHDFIVCGKIPTESQEVSGHDFSRAANVANSVRALAPERRFYFLDV
jgi:hypothetical protein